MFSKITSVCLIVLLSFVSCSKKVKIRFPSAPISIQQKATHMLHLIAVDSEGNEHPDGMCTVTSIGPHVLLGAKHCFEEFDKIVTLDLSTFKYHVLAATEDYQEHIMVAVDGPEFTNYIDLSKSSREVVPGEAVYMYGCGAGAYPPRLLSGNQIPDFDSQSEVDQAAHIQQFSMHDVPGDSGAAIFGEDGKIVALVTYGHDKTTVGFGLNFTPDQIEVALTAGKGQTL